MLGHKIFKCTAYEGGSTLFFVIVKKLAKTFAYTIFRRYPGNAYRIICNPAAFLKSEFTKKEESLTRFGGYPVGISSSGI